LPIGIADAGTDMTPQNAAPATKPMARALTGHLPYCCCMASSGRQASLSLPLLRPPGKVGRWQQLRGLGPGDLNRKDRSRD
jgi:hypothetical protein